MNYVLFVVGVIASIAEDIISLSSRIVNRLLFRGSRHQTLSSRAHLQSRKSKFWYAVRCIINSIFFLQNDHCADAWLEEVTNAYKTLEQNDAL